MGGREVRRLQTADPQGTSNPGVLQGVRELVLQPRVREETLDLVS